MASCLVMHCAISGGLVWPLANARRISMSFHFQCQLLLSLLCVSLMAFMFARQLASWRHRRGITLAESWTWRSHCHYHYHYLDPCWCYNGNKTVSAKGKGNKTCSAIETETETESESQTETETVLVNLKIPLKNAGLQHLGEQVALLCYLLIWLTNWPPSATGAHR